MNERTGELNQLRVLRNFVDSYTFIVVAGVDVSFVCALRSKWPLIVYWMCFFVVSFEQLDHWYALRVILMNAWYKVCKNFNKKAMPLF